MQSFTSHTLLKLHNVYNYFTYWSSASIWPSHIAGSYKKNHSGISILIGSCRCMNTCRCTFMSLNMCLRCWLVSFYTIITNEQEYIFLITHKQLQKLEWCLTAWWNLMFWPTIEMAKIFMSWNDKKYFMISLILYFNKTSTS